MAGLTINEEVSVFKISISENQIVNQVSVNEDSGFPNRIGINGKSPFIGDNGYWFAYDDITREFYDTGILANGEDRAIEIDGLKIRVGAVEASINDILQKPDEVQAYSTFLLFPNIGKEGIIYIDESENKSYRWDSGNIKYFLLNDDTYQIINGGN